LSEIEEVGFLLNWIEKLKCIWITYWMQVTFVHGWLFTDKSLLPTTTNDWKQAS